MKHIALLLCALYALGATTLSAQTEPTEPATTALRSPENTDSGLLGPRSALVCYASREELNNGKQSSLALPLTSWQVDSLAEGVRYTTRFKRNYRYDDKEIVLRVEGATGAISILVNDKEVGYNASAKGRSEFDLTKKLVPNNNTISICVHRNYAAQAIEAESNSTPSFERATLLTPPRVAVADAVVATRMNKQGDGLMSLGVVMQSFLLNSKDYNIYYELYDPEGKMVSSANKELTTRMLSRDTVNFHARIPAIKGWSPKEANLYKLVIYTRHENRIKEFTSTHIGFRTVEVKDGQLVLNGNNQTIAATLFPTDTPAADEEKLIGQLQKEGYNLLFVARPRSDEFYSLCDRMGMMVCSSADISCPENTDQNTPSNNPDWKKSYLTRTTSAYHATKIHPSVVMFSIGHKAQNGICLYESYLAMKAIEGESRPIVYPDANGQWNSDL